MPTRTGSRSVDRWRHGGRSVAPDARAARDRFRVDHLTLASSRPDDHLAASGRGRPARRAHGHAQPQRETAGARQRALRLRVERDAQAQRPPPRAASHDAAGGRAAAGQAHRRRAPARGRSAAAAAPPSRAAAAPPAASGTPAAGLRATDLPSGGFPDVAPGTSARPQYGSAAGGQPPLGDHRAVRHGLAQVGHRAGDVHAVGLLPGEHRAVRRPGRRRVRPARHDAAQRRERGRRLADAEQVDLVPARDRREPGAAVVELALLERRAVVVGEPALVVGLAAADAVDRRRSPPCRRRGGTSARGRRRTTTAAAGRARRRARADR